MGEERTSIIGKAASLKKAGVPTAVTVAILVLSTPGFYEFFLDGTDDEAMAKAEVAYEVLTERSNAQSREVDRLRDEGMSGLISRLQESYFKEEGIEQLTAAKVGAALRKIGIKARASGKDVGIIIKVPEGDHRKALDMLREKFKYPGIGWEGHGKADMWVLEPIEIRHAKARDAERKRVGNWMGKGVNVR